MRIFVVVVENLRNPAQTDFRLKTMGDIHLPPYTRNPRADLIELFSIRSKG